MSAKTGDLSFETLSENIYAGDTKITKIYAGDTLVYPTKDNEVLRYSMIFFLNDYVISKYDRTTPINQYGAYILVKPSIEDVYRAAFRVYSDGAYWYRKPFISAKGFKATFTTVRYVPFVARDYEIIADGYTSDSITTYSLDHYSYSGRYYYSRQNYVRANLVDANGHYLTNFQIGTGGEHTKLFDTEDDCIKYVTGFIN